MAVNTIAFSALKQALSEALGDFLEFDTTTNITTNNSVISTTLRQYDDGAGGHFDNWWLEITEGNNAAVIRRTGLPGTTTYATATGTSTVMGAALLAESAAVTCRLHRYDPTLKSNAIKEAGKEIYPTLFLPLEDQTLIAGNILPDGSFESWSSATALNHYTTSSSTLARTTTAGLVRNGTYSVKVTASAANGRFHISSDTYQRLKDLQGQTVSLYCWAYPEVADDAKIEIYTIQADGTEQTLTSTTTCPAGKWTELKLENQTLNDNLHEIQVRFKVATDTKYAYFDDAMLQGRTIYEYLLPDNFRDGDLSQVFLQRWGHSDEPCYDLNPFATINPGREYGFSITDEGSQRYVRFSEALSSKNRLRLVGLKPLETLSADADTLTLDTEKQPLLIARAEMLFHERYMRPVSAEDVSRFNFTYGMARRKYRELFFSHRMSSPAKVLMR